MKTAADGIAEIESFLHKLRFRSPIKASEENKTAFVAAYKQFHALLVWGLVAEAQPSIPLPTKTYFREFLSDMSHAFMLTLLHFYKPARASLRSGIENLVRALLLMRGVDATMFEAVHKLFQHAVKHFSQEPQIARNIQQLKNNYAHLCKSVHSAKIDYMSLTVPFNQLCIMHTSQYASNISDIKSVSRATNQAIFWIWHAELRKAGHKNEDLVRDSLPKTLKRAVGAA